MSVLYEIYKISSVHWRFITNVPIMQVYDVRIVLMYKNIL